MSQLPTGVFSPTPSNPHRQTESGVEAESFES